LTKAAGGNTLYRGGGSIGIIGAARSGLVVASDPEDPERRILAANKNNLSRAAQSLVFRVEGAPNGAARVVWGGTSDLSASDILREPADSEQRSALAEAKDFLLKELAEGPVAAESVKKDARATGISERTLKRAKRALDVRSEKASDGTWSWVLSNQEEPEGSQGPTAGILGTVGPLGKDANPRRAQSAYLEEGAKEAKRAKAPTGTGCSGAATATRAAKDATSTTRTTLTGARKGALCERRKGRRAQYAGFRTVVDWSIAENMRICSANAPERSEHGHKFG
jgi:hypothetical protein